MVCWMQRCIHIILCVFFNVCHQVKQPDINRKQWYYWKHTSNNKRLMVDPYIKRTYMLWRKITNKRLSITVCRIRHKKPNKSLWLLSFWEQIWTPALTFHCMSGRYMVFKRNGSGRHIRRIQNIKEPEQYDYSNSHTNTSWRGSRKLMVA